MTEGKKENSQELEEMHDGKMTAMRRLVMATASLRVGVACKGRSVVGELEQCGLEFSLHLYLY